MADKSKIEWTDATWNPITGCSMVSPGCTNCYAMRLAGTRMKHHPSRADLTIDTKAGPVWNGEVRLNVQWLDQPRRWTKPRMIFVCAHGDLFHERVPDEWINCVLAIMAMSPRHTFQVLTKRAERMRQYFEALGGGFELWRDVITDDAAIEQRVTTYQWPLPNVWLGVSAEDQPRADERIPELLGTPAAVRFVSYEPALGPVDFTPWLWRPKATTGGSGVPKVMHPRYDEPAGLLHWIIAGGESGPDKRPYQIEWFADALEQCRAAGTAFYMKQLDKVAPIPELLMVREMPR